MKTFLEQESAPDYRLVELCLQGNRDAFARIVARYQSVVCAIAYSACGDIGRSEDLAQETFVTAWRKLAELREPEKLKSWLCGITRNLVQNSVRQQQRIPTARAEELSPETCSPAANPQEMAISNEEEALMWRALETMPPDYREPMVLFYREGQSAEKVGAALDLTEEAVRQRLSRGRVMLNERMTKTVERALFRSAPGKVFTLAVLAALPAFAVSASAATVGTSATKGSAAAKAAASLGLLSMLAGPLFAFFGTYIGYKLSIENAHTPRARELITKFYRWFGITVVSFLLLIAVLTTKWGVHVAKFHPAYYSAAILTIVGLHTSVLIALIFWVRKFRRSLDREGFRASQSFWNPYAAKPQGIEYRSRMSLLGLPLIHVRIGGADDHGDGGTVKAWFAVGNIAVGVIFAFGGMAVAPISFGGIGIGLITVSGLGLAAISLSGIGIGIWSLGGTAIGVLAYGGCAIGWHGAAGGIAIAHDYALGGMAFGAHANDAVARTFIDGSRVFSAAAIIMKHLALLNMAWILPLYFLLFRSRRIAAMRAGK